MIIETLRIVTRRREKDEGGFRGKRNRMRGGKDKVKGVRGGYKCVVCGVWCGKQ